jgi:hypothetical protein
MVQSMMSGLYVLYIILFPTKPKAVPNHKKTPRLGCNWVTKCHLKPT